MSIRIIEIPINQSHLLNKEHASECPMKADPHCDYCTCGLKSKNKLVGKKRNNSKTINYKHHLREQRISKLSESKESFSKEPRNKKTKVY